MQFYLNVVTVKMVAIIIFKPERQDGNDCVKEEKGEACKPLGGITKLLGNRAALGLDLQHVL